MIRLQARYECGFSYGKDENVTTYRLYTEKGCKTLYEVDAWESGVFSLDWDDRFLLAKTPYLERTFETLSDAVVYAERHLDILRKSDKVFKLNLDGHFPLTINEDEAKDFSKWFGKPYKTVENPWRKIS